MKEFPRNLLICFLLAVPLFIAGYNLHEYVVESLIKTRMSVSSLGGVFFAKIGFALGLVLIPFAIVLCWKFLPINLPKKRIWSAILITTSALLTFAYRIYWVKQLTAPRLIPKIEGAEFMIPFESLNFENFLFVGIAVGVVLVILFMGDKRSQQISPVSSTN